MKITKNTIKNRVQHSDSARSRYFKNFNKLNFSVKTSEK